MASSIINSDDGVVSGTSGLKTTGGDDGALAVQSNGTEVAKFKTTELVINDGGANYDFRVEGDTDANLLVVDASTDRVGIGVSPTSKLDVNGLAKANAFGMNANGGSVSTGMAAPISDTLGFYVNTTERMRIDNSGNLLVGTTSAMAEGVGIQVGEVGIDGVSGFGMTSAVSIADDATITLSANTGLLVFIEYYQDPVDGNVYPAAMFFCSYAGTVQLVSNSGGQFAAADTDGKACVFKSTNSDTVTVKNRLGSTKSYSIHTLQLRGQ
jgi:hypothetical protein